MINLLMSLFWLFMPWVGLAAVVALFVLKLAPSIPWRFSRRISEWCLQTAFGIMGKEIALVRTRDNRYALSRSEYDPENGVLWVDYGEVLKGYDTNGDGLKSLPFFGSNLWLVYEDLGAVADIVSAEIGRQARANYEDAYEGTVGAGITSSLPAGGEALADGGEADDDLDKHEVRIPSSGVVADLRNCIHFAPYNVQPAAYKRIERNAKAGLEGFSNWGPVAQTGGMLGAFFLGGLLVWFVMDNDGGGGGSDVVPMMIELSMSGVIT